MLPKDPCKLCLVKPSCSVFCDEKKARGLKLEKYRIPPLLAFFAFVVLIFICYSLSLLFLKKIGIISKEKYDQLDPFMQMDMLDPH